MIVNTDDLHIPVAGTVIDEDLWDKFLNAIGGPHLKSLCAIKAKVNGKDTWRVGYALHNGETRTVKELLIDIIAKGD